AQLAFDGKAMYFASNRPGGYGGFDIYVSYFKKGNWTIPENLGDMVNSKGNEITPFFDGKSLYFSSDYHHGLGGFDVFKTEVISGQWAYPENLGKGANSPGDDYYFVKNMNSGEMYLSSNRIGGRGADDIYRLNEIQNFDFADFEVPKQELEEPMVPKAVTIANLDKAQEEELSSDFESMLEDAFEEEDVVSGKLLKEEEISTNSKNVMETENSDVSVAKKVVSSYNAEVNLMGAKRISINSVVNVANNTTVYFVQVAALSRRKPDLKRYASLVKYGNLYKFYKTNSTKIRVGYYFEKDEATEILSKVRKMGFGDAFITPTILDPGEMELVASSYDLDYIPEASETFIIEVRPVSKYKVRLASYADPLWFDVESVKDMGELEQWTKGSWTIFLLSGYATRSEAEKALNKAVVRGFVDAQLVMDNSGVLTRVK
ncbi:MAG: hypothetical protein HKN86_06755, partial [Acidimicrobiia bacterium]|nr:hypothetical protein [Acidimicrobiia bacterium]